MLDIRLGLPQPIFELSEEERERRARVANDAAVLDGERYFVRAVVELPIPELDDRFAYGTWVEVAEDDYRRLGELWYDPAQAEAPPFRGRIANELEPYVHTVGLPVELRLHSVDQLPAARLADSDHPLVRDQRAGISRERSDELAAVVLH